MDRFKFRFWNKLRKAYENTYDLKCCEHLDYVIPEQCTGLKDKNGKLIYEGDIVHYIKHTNFGLGGDRIAQVLWDNDIGMFYIKTTYGDCYNCNDFEIEVIGNIHENFDLLGEE